jgi:hypothetical protein
MHTQAQYTECHICKVVQQLCVCHHLLKILTECSLVAHNTDQMDAFYKHLKRNSSY